MGGEGERAKRNWEPNTGDQCSFDSLNHYWYQVLHNQ